jgi:hypothetical protein
MKNGWAISCVTVTFAAFGIDDCLYLGGDILDKKVC